MPEVNAEAICSTVSTTPLTNYPTLCLTIRFRCLMSLYFRASSMNTIVSGPVRSSTKPVSVCASVESTTRSDSWLVCLSLIPPA